MWLLIVLIFLHGFEGLLACGADYGGDYGEEQDPEQAKFNNTMVDKWKIISGEGGWNISNFLANGTWPPRGSELWAVLMERWLLWNETRNSSHELFPGFGDAFAEAFGLALGPGDGDENAPGFGADFGFILKPGYGSGSGFGSGFSSGFGFGPGSGYGSGSGHGPGSGHGHGSGSGWFKNSSGWFYNGTVSGWFKNASGWFYNGSGLHGEGTTAGWFKNSSGWFYNGSELYREGPGSGWFQNASGWFYNGSGLNGEGTTAGWFKNASGWFYNGSLHGPGGGPGYGVYRPPFCFLGSKYGDCTHRKRRWCYKQDIDACHRFIYSGCGGNQNNFETKEACEKLCKEPKTGCDDLASFDQFIYDMPR